MTGGVVSKTLAEELAEKIFVMMSFPLIFKACLLSNSWQARFQSIESQDDQEQKRRPRSFQKQVAKCMPEEESLIGFDQTLRTQQRQPSPSFLPEKLYEAFETVKCYSRTYLGDNFSFCSSSELQIEGLFLYRMLEINSMCHKELHVANILTRQYKKTLKKLPARPNLDQSIGCLKLLIEPCAQTYELGERSFTKLR